MMTRCPWLTSTLAILVVGGWVASVEAQMFGNRTVGRPLSRRQSPGQQATQEDVGTLQGNERFLRTNRRPTDFVGPDLRELQRFIGAIQARSPLASPAGASELRRRIDRSGSVNQPLKPSGRGEYAQPKLVLDFGSSVTTHGPDLTDFRHAVGRHSRLDAANQIEVSLAGRTATLRGEVGSAADRDLVALLVSFEPGVSSIHNELKVVPQSPARPQPATALAQPADPPERPAWETLSHGSRQASRGRGSAESFPDDLRQPQQPPAGQR